MACEHDAAEMDTAAHWDGLCPLCMKAEAERLRTAIFNTINDLDKKKPNIKAMRNYLAGVYNAPR